MEIDKIVIGQKYRFNDSPSLRSDLRGKIFKVISRTKLQAYNDDGSAILNPSRQPWFYYSGTIIRHVESILFEPLEHLPKHSLIHD